MFYVSAFCVSMFYVSMFYVSVFYESCPLLMWSLFAGTSGGHERDVVLTSFELFWNARTQVSTSCVAIICRHLRAHEIDILCLHGLLQL